VGQGIGSSCPMANLWIEIGTNGCFDVTVAASRFTRIDAMLERVHQRAVREHHGAH